MDTMDIRKYLLYFIIMHFEFPNIHVSMVMVDNKPKRSIIVVTLDGIHSFFFYIRTFLIRTLRLRFDQKFKKMYGMK